MTHGVTRGDRLRDLLSIALMVAAVIPIAYAWRGFLALSDEAAIVVAPGGTAFAQFMHYFWFALAGLLLLVSGIGVAVWSFLRRQRRLRHERP